MESSGRSSSHERREKMMTAKTRVVAAELEEQKPTEGYFEIQAEGCGDQLDKGSEGEEERRVKPSVLLWASRWTACPPPK